MTDTDAKRLAANKKRRGVAKASITRLTTCLSKLERTPDDPRTLTSAQRLLTKLGTLDKEFKDLHLAVVDLTEGEDDLANEQQTLDEHDDGVSQLEERIQRFIATCSTAPDADARKIPSNVSHMLRRN